MYLISHPLMVLPLLRITQGIEGWGWGHKGIAGERGAVAKALRTREHDLRKTEGRAIQSRVLGRTWRAETRRSRMQKKESKNPQAGK